MNPVTVIPWDRDFLTGLAEQLLERFQTRFESLIVLFPHRRPRRYLLDKLSSDERLAKPCILPRIVSIDELFAELAGRITATPLRPLSELDRVGVLHRVVTGLRAGLRGPDNALPEEVKDFFPWGLKLSSLLEELFQQGVAASNLDHVQDMVMPTAAALLGSLKTIQAAYREALVSQGACTPGLLRSIVADDPAKAVAILDGKLILACGFHALTGSEEALLKPLWSKGAAEILWHTDPAIAGRGAKPHWSCEEHVRWLKSWKATAQLATDDKLSPLPSWRTRTDQFSLFSAAQEPEPARRASITFHQGFDLHSQLMTLRKELDACGDTAGYAVVLPDTSMLMPVLHHLPRRDVNVSMGFPMWRSPLFQLIETILRLQDGRMPGGYHWREVITLLRHPLLKLLRLGDETPLRMLFHDWEAFIRQGEKYVDPAAWVPADADPQSEELRQRVVRVCFTAFEDTTTPRRMAQALLGLAELLLDPEHSGGRWERFIIDAACLAGLIDQVIPELHDSSISQEAFPPEAVRAMARELLKRQRAPFEADPLSGLQVLGMLETRLLTFEKIFILGATEEALPGIPRPDPLLPDPLRQALGLPGQRERDLTSAHTFYRLIQGAKDVDILYSSGIQPGILDGKSMPSRYVEQLLWEEEKRQGRLIKPGEGPRRLITLPMRGVRPSLGAVENTPACRLKLETHLRYRGVSPTLLDSFLNCPLAFFYKYLTPLEPLQEVAEEGDPPAFGQLAHEALQDFFAPLLGKPIAQGGLDGQRLAAIFSAKLHEAPFFRQMPAHARLMLERTALLRLTDFARNTPACTPLETEKRIKARLQLDGEQYDLTGTVDRLDQREGGLFILDYKTGTPKKTAKKFWDDEDIWQIVGSGDTALGLLALPQIAEKLGSIQMPLYMHAFWKDSGREAANAVFVCLGKGGEETPLFGPDVDEETISTRIQEQTPLLAGFILRMMLETPAFAPLSSRSCAWCAWRQACSAAAGE
ncbi:MAG: PD-(D/E)XK nuclease family protein [Desulfovibrio sp.]|nr:PD-(D/E)XK nuclease family protein [Desulfovibrio sp.]MBI4959065.1 PD-(D/E)XK nuclease family protein [Desulfovibrio sp.]